MSRYLDTNRTKDMISLRQSGKTLQQIGDAFGISRERARQLVGYIKRPKLIKTKLTLEERKIIRSAIKINNFWSLVERKEDNDCWLWKGRISPTGYGKFCNEYAHRFAYKTVFGARIMDGLDVLHKCDNPPCVNPIHLFLGTQADNNLDRDKKNRSRKKKFLFTIEQANEIRKKHATGGKIQLLAKEYNVSYETMRRIIANETYKS